MHILVVENDDDFRIAWVQLLSQFGHTFLDLDRLGGRKAQDLVANHFGLALVDCRARDDRDEEDTSGLDFAVELCRLGTAAVLVTNYPPEGAALFDLLRTGELSGIADKSVDKLELAKCVEEFDVSHRFPNCVARFQWWEKGTDVFTIEDWEEVRSEVRAGEATDASREDFAVLFRSLIPTCARSVKLKKITPGHGGAALCRAWVSSGDGPVVEEVAIKYGDRAAIRGEAMRYDRHVGPLPDGVAAHLRWRKETRNLGALAYSWLGDSIEDGVPFGPIPSHVLPERHGDSPLLTWRRRRAALERLFSVSLNPWYEVYRSEDAKLASPIRLLEYYKGENGDRPKVPLDAGMRRADLPSPIRQEDGYWNFGPYGKLIDPVDWLTKGEGSSLQLNRYCPCHGDLHVKNIFVLPDDSPRLIDFGDTALGHVFRDFAALEVSIRLTCCSTTDLDDLRHASDFASRTRNLGEHIDYRSIPETLVNLRETLITTMQIRRAALDAVGLHPPETRMKEYLFALTVRMLGYAAGIADEISSDEEASEEGASRVWHALYGAASAAQQAVNLTG
jgi:hypothetical protein